MKAIWTEEGSKEFLLPSFLKYSCRVHLGDLVISLHQRLLPHAHFELEVEQFFRCALPLSALCPLLRRLRGLLRRSQSLEMVGPSHETTVFRDNCTDPFYTS